MKKEKRIVLWLVWIMAAFILCGCSKSKSASAQAKDKATFQVDQQGNLIVTYTEDFKESYYSKDELEKKINDELKEFNENYATDKNKGVTQESLTVKNKKAVLKLKFTCSQDYMNYYQNYIDSTRNARLYIGKYDDAAAAGFTFSGEYIKEKDSKKVASDQLKDTDKYQLIYTNEAQTIYIDGTIEYYTSKVKVEDGVATTSDKTDNFIIYKLEK